MTDDKPGISDSDYFNKETEKAPEQKPLLVNPQGRVLNGDIACMILDECISASLKTRAKIIPVAKEHGDIKVMELVDEHIKDLKRARKSAEVFFLHVNKK